MTRINVSRIATIVAKFPGVGEQMTPAFETAEVVQAAKELRFQVGHASGSSGHSQVEARSGYEIRKDIRLVRQGPLNVTPASYLEGSREFRINTDDRRRHLACKVGVSATMRESLEKYSAVALGS
jgi:hypothetical protein